MSAPSPAAASAHAERRRADLRAYGLLTLAFVFFALNIIVGRAVHADVPPIGLSFWRWTIASALFLPFTFARVRAQWPLLVANWKSLALLAFAMMMLGNTLVYIGLQSTTALNGGLIPASRPVLILILAWIVFRGTVTGRQWLGIAVAFSGVLLVITRGEPETLRSLDVNPGDLWLLLSSVGFASYQVLIARTPKALDPAVVLQATMALGALMLFPVYLWESHAVRPVPFAWLTAVTVLYVAVFPSIVSVYLVNISIPVLGPARASVFNYLQPLFVGMLAVPVLGEQLRWYHPTALVLVALGIVIASRARKQ